MGVNHYILPVDDGDLASVLADPDSMHDFVEARDEQVCEIFTQGPAITFLIADDEHDAIAFFLEEEGPEGQTGWVGEYEEADGRVVTCQVDMGYGPASFYRWPYVAQFARKLADLTEEQFASRFDADVLEDVGVYPGGWHDADGKEYLVQCYATLRKCVTRAATNRQNLLIWCA